MKKRITLYLFILFLCMSTIQLGCNNNTTKNDINYESILNEFLNTIEIPDYVNDNILLFTEYEYKNQIITASWESSNPEILSSTGTINQQDDYTEVTLIGHFTLSNSICDKKFIIGVEELSNEEIGNKIINLITIPLETSTDLSLPRFIEYNKKSYMTSWASSDETIINKMGNIKKYQEDKQVILTVSVSYNKTIIYKDFTVLVKAFDTSNMYSFLNNFQLNTNCETNINLPNTYDDGINKYNVSWSSSNESVLSNEGIITQGLEDTVVDLIATISIDNISISKKYSITIKKANSEKIFLALVKTINIPKIIRSNIFLPTIFDNNLIGSWNSSSQDLLSNTGEILINSTEPKKLTLTLSISIEGETMTNEFETTILKQDHFFMLSNFNEGALDNLTIDSKGRLILEDNNLSGTFTSKNYTSSNFTDAVATWCSTSSKNATCELFVRLCINNEWSDYISYGEWGLELENKCIDQKNKLIRLNDDEIQVLNSKKASGFSFKLILKRTKTSIQSPIVSRITLALNLATNNYQLDSSLLEKSIRYNVPTLYQHDVPTIGNSICSATSSTMLLKYKDHNFLDKDSLEHRYIAKIVRDYGNKIYGNWVYNCVGMSSFGEIAYVKRYMNTIEFLYEIQKIGPMAASIKGTVNYSLESTNQAGAYTTNGHLIVVTGFEILNNIYYIYINDPNVNGVKIKMTLDDFSSVWRNIAYVIE